MAKNVLPYQAIYTNNKRPTSNEQPPLSSDMCSNYPHTSTTTTLLKYIYVYIKGAACTRSTKLLVARARHAPPQTLPSHGAGGAHGPPRPCTGGATGPCPPCSVAAATPWAWPSQTGPPWLQDAFEKKKKKQVLARYSWLRYAFEEENEGTRVGPVLLTTRCIWRKKKKHVLARDSWHLYVGWHLQLHLYILKPWSFCDAHTFMCPQRAHEAMDDATYKWQVNIQMTGKHTNNR